MTVEQEQSYRASLKHPDVEEHIDLWFYRPVGFRLALLGARFGWTPNFISVLSIFLGIGCGLLIYPVDWRLNLLGMLFLVLADICDSADGQLARLTQQFSRLGRILDGACGDIWFITIYLSIVFRLLPEYGIWIWLLAAAAGMSHRSQAAIADYYRNFHLLIVKGAAGSELDDAKIMLQEYKQVRFSDAPLYKIFMWFYCSYTQFQEHATPYLQQLRHKMNDHPEMLTPAFYEAVRQESLPLMKFCNALTFNWRAIILTVSVMCGYPWLYFVAELTLGNVLLTYMKCKHEKFCQRFAS